MELFQIDYLKKTGALMKEAFTFKKYKAMHPALATFVGIFMSPFLLIGLLLTAVLAVFAFVVNLLLAPAKHLHSLLHTEGQSVKHATQFIIYLVSWTVFFFIYLVLSFLFIPVYLLYTILSIVMYIFTLGGFKYHISPNADSDDIAINTKGRYLALPIVTICVSSVLLVVALIFGVMAMTSKPAVISEDQIAYLQENELYVEGIEEWTEEEIEEYTYEWTDEQYEEYMELADASLNLNLIIAAACAGVYMLFNMLMSLIGYAPRCLDKGEKEECCCCEAPVVEAIAEVAETAEAAEVVEVAAEEPVTEEVNA